MYLDYNVSSGPFLSFEIEIGDGPGPKLDNILCRNDVHFCLVLLTRWRQLSKQLKKDEKLNLAYWSLKDSILNLDQELDQLESQIKINDLNKSRLKKIIRFYKDCKIRLARIKPRLFELNLTVHNLLGDVSQDESEVNSSK